MRSGEWKTREAGRAFTMVELLVVFGVIVVLVGVAWPVTVRMVRNSHQVRCLSNLREIGVGIEAYLSDHANRYPEIEMARASRDEPVPVLETALEDYLPSAEVFHCPADREVFKASGSSYLWNSTQSGRHRLQTSFLGIENQPPRVPLVIDKEAFHGKPDGVNMLYADYHLSDKVDFRAGRR